jgi:hypothetical protein
LEYGGKYQKLNNKYIAEFQFPFYSYHGIQMPGAIGIWEWKLIESKWGKNAARYIG